MSLWEKRETEAVSGVVIGWEMQEEVGVEEKGMREQRERKIGGRGELPHQSIAGAGSLKTQHCLLGSQVQFCDEKEGTQGG